MTRFQVLQALTIRVEPFDESLAVAAGLLRRPTRSAGLSLGDRACLALAARLSVSAMTTDRAWTTLDPALGPHVDLLR